MPLVCEGGLCEYVPEARKKLELLQIEQAKEERSALSDTSDSPWEEEGLNEKEEEEDMTVDPKLAKTYLLEEGGVGLDFGTDVGCFPSDRKGEPDGAFTLYNPYIISYVIDLQKTDPPTEVGRTLQILQHLIQAVDSDPKYGRTIGFHGGIAAVLTVMDTHKKSSRVQEKACHLLGSMTEKNVELQDIVSENFGVTRILAAMTTHRRGKAGLHREACYALSSVLQLQANATQFSLCRGVNVVMKTLKHYARSSNIQLYGTAILRILSKDNIGSIDYPQIVDSITFAMKNNRKSNGIQINGCAVLYALAKEGRQETQAALVSNDVVGLLLSCMKENLDVAVIQCQCCAALTYLAQRRCEARDAMVRDGAVTIIWDSLKHHEGDEDVQLEGTRALRCLSRGPTGPPVPEPTFTDEAQCLSDECY